MLLRVITLRFSTALDGFDDCPLTDFLRDKSVLSLRDHFFVRNETPYLAVVVTYEPMKESLPPGKNGDKRRQGEESWRGLLSDAAMPLFDTLRSWRSERCKQEGIPPYVICTNKQLANMVAARPQSLAALLQVEGFGQAKAEKYGQALLELLRMNDEK